jgi:hypothetical protein
MAEDGFSDQVPLELWLDIFDYLSPADWRNIRLVNRKWSDIAATPLYRSLSFTFTDTSIERLRQIAQKATLASRVRSLERRKDPTMVTFVTLRYWTKFVRLQPNHTSQDNVAGVLQSYENWHDVPTSSKESLYVQFVSELKRTRRVESAKMRNDLYNLQPILRGFIGLSKFTDDCALSLEILRWRGLELVRNDAAFYRSYGGKYWLNTDSMYSAYTLNMLARAKPFLHFLTSLRCNVMGDHFWTLLPPSSYRQVLGSAFRALEHVDFEDSAGMYTWRFVEQDSPLGEALCNANNLRSLRVVLAWKDPSLAPILYKGGTMLLRHLAAEHPWTRMTKVVLGIRTSASVLLRFMRTISGSLLELNLQCVGLEDSGDNDHQAECCWQHLLPQIVQTLPVLERLELGELHDHHGYIDFERAKSQFEGQEQYWKERHCCFDLYRCTIIARLLQKRRLEFPLDPAEFLHTYLADGCGVCSGPMESEET